MNPYAKQLGGLDPLEVIAATGLQLNSLLAAIGPERAERPWAPGKWSPSQIACHLADCEIAFAFRLRQALAEDHHRIQPFDQDQWAAAYRTGAYELAAALAVFAAVRQWNLALVRSLPPAAFDKQVTHPERGPMSYRALVETMAGHDRNHLAQLEAVARA
ncbi:MAG TPA: DinB family protein [Terriglobales bacterium]|nr:DinB family protein [Terriglobales bacterium]